MELFESLQGGGHHFQFAVVHGTGVDAGSFQRLDAVCLSWQSGDPGKQPQPAHGDEQPANQETPPLGEWVSAFFRFGWRRHRTSDF